MRARFKTHSYPFENPQKSIDINTPHDPFPLLFLSFLPPSLLVPSTREGKYCKWPNYPNQDYSSKKKRKGLALTILAYYGTNIYAIFGIAALRQTTMTI